jgi:hypothetical protein
VPEKTDLPQGGGGRGAGYSTETGSLLRYLQQKKSFFFFRVDSTRSRVQEFLEFKSFLLRTHSSAIRNVRVEKTRAQTQTLSDNTNLWNESFPLASAGGGKNTDFDFDFDWILLDQFN